VIGHHRRVVSEDTSSMEGCPELYCGWLAQNLGLATRMRGLLRPVLLRVPYHPYEML